MGNHQRDVSIKLRLLLGAAIALSVLSMPRPAISIEAHAVKESVGGSSRQIVASCPLSANQNGTCANYEWYTACSGYVWIFTEFESGTEVGVRFGGAENPCVAPGNFVKRAITYFRTTFPNYTDAVTVFVDVDSNSDGCPDRVLAQEVIDPATRWNCSNFNVVIPGDAPSLIIRTRISATPGGLAPWLATDGPHTATCDPLGTPRSFYYGLAGQDICLPWSVNSPTGRNDNFFYHLIIDAAPTATEPMSWGNIKAIYQ